MRHEASAIVARCRCATTRTHANSFLSTPGTGERAVGCLSRVVAESRDERSDAARVLTDASTTPFFAYSTFVLLATFIPFFVNTPAHHIYFHKFEELAMIWRGQQVSAGPVASSMNVSCMTWQMLGRVGIGDSTLIVSSKANLNFRRPGSARVWEVERETIARRSAAVRASADVCLDAPLLCIPTSIFCPSCHRDTLPH